MRNLLHWTVCLAFFTANSTSFGSTEASPFGSWSFLSRNFAKAAALFVFIGPPGCASLHIPRPWAWIPIVANKASNHQFHKHKISTHRYSNYFNPQFIGRYKSTQTHNKVHPNYRLTQTEITLIHLCRLIDAISISSMHTFEVYYYKNLIVYA